MSEEATINKVPYSKLGNSSLSTTEFNNVGTDKQSNSLHDKLYCNPLAAQNIIIQAIFYIAIAIYL